MITLVLPDEIRTWWGELGTRLSPAILVDPKRKVADVYQALMSGEFALFQINENSVNMLAVVQIAQIDEAKCFSLFYLAGSVKAPPRLWLAKVRDLMQIAIKTAKDLHCTEMRLEGRDWRKVFPDWEWQNERNQMKLKV